MESSGKFKIIAETGKKTETIQQILNQRPAALLAGADGYITKQMPAETLVQGLLAVLCGNSFLLPHSVKAVFRQLAEIEGDNPALLDLLSVQEKKILYLIAAGKTNKEIASSLSLSEKTVKNYVSNILGKLRLSNRAEAAAMLTRHKVWFSSNNWSG